MAKKKVVKKKVAKKKYPSTFTMIVERMHREGRYQDFQAKYKFHKDFGMDHSRAMWAAAKDMGYKDLATEKELYDEQNRKGVDNYHTEKHRAEVEADQLEQELRELSSVSLDQKFDPVSGIEWVASVFHLEHVTPAECPHIIAWNVLQTSKKYEVAFFKDFLMKALQKGVTAESVEEFAEDESQMDDLRQAVIEAIQKVPS